MTVSLAAALVAIAGPRTAVAADDDAIPALKAQLQRQQAIIESQEARLEAQERLLRELAARIGQPLPPVVAAAVAPPAAVAEAAASTTPTPTPTPLPVMTRFNGMTVALSGSLRTTVTTTTARMLPDATPFLVLPKVPGVPEGSTKIDARLSSLLISVHGAKVGDFKLGGMIYAYLFNGDLLSGSYGFYPGFAYIDATSDRWRFAVGLQQDVFSPLMPTMVDRMSALAGSGNPGNSFKPQLRAERFVVVGDDRIVLQGALADALPTNIKPQFDGSTENTGTPNVEGRIAWTRGSADTDGAWLDWPRFTLGLSAVSGSFRTLYATNGPAFVETHLNGVALEGGWRIGSRFGVQGELYSGESLGPYLASVFHTANAATRRGIRSHGGWGEVAWYWSKQLHSHVGWGLDRANLGDLTDGLHTNQTAFSNLFFDPSPKSTFGIEATWRRTDYAGLDPTGTVAHDGFALMLSSELRF